MLKSACTQGYYGTDCRKECGASCKSGTCDSQTDLCICKNSNWEPQISRGKMSDEIISFQSCTIQLRLTATVIFNRGFFDFSFASKYSLKFVQNCL